MLRFDTAGVFEWLSGRSFLGKLGDGLLVLFFVVIARVAYGAVDGYLTAPETSSYDLFIETTQIHQNIQPVIDRLRVELDADMVMFMRYHNGVHGLNGFSFMKKSGVNFSAQPHYTFHVEDTQNIPISTDIDMLQHHLIGECVFRITGSELTLFPILNKNGVDAYATCPVFNNEKLIGQVSVTWTHTPDDPDLNRILKTSKEIGEL